MEVDADFAPSSPSSFPTGRRPSSSSAAAADAARAAAVAMTAAGYGRCYNVAKGFEGNPDPERHRGKTGGWKAEGLPWVQD